MTLRSVPAQDPLTTALDVRRELPGGALEEVFAIPVEAVGALAEAAASLIPQSRGGEATPYAEMLAETAEACHTELLRLVSLLEAWS